MTIRYSDKVTFVPSTIGHKSHTIEVPPYWVPTPSPNNPIWRRIHQVYDMEHFQYAAPPLELGRVDISLDNLQGLRVLRCPIKAPGMSHIVLPDELLALKPLIIHVLETERHINPKFMQFWAHITFEQTFIEKGQYQRVPGWHVDGTQGVRVPVHQVEHSYLWATSQAVEVCIQPFFLTHLDRSRHNLFHEIEKQAIEHNAIAGMANHVYLIDPYVVHRTPQSTASGWRAICRITFTATELEDPVNTINNSLLPSIEYTPRVDARNRLSPYEGPIPWAMYGLKR